MYTPWVTPHMSTQYPTSDHSLFQNMPISLGNFGGDTVSNVLYLLVMVAHIHTVQKKFKRGQVIFEATSVKSDVSVAWPIQWCEICGGTQK